MTDEETNEMSNDEIMSYFVGDDFIDDVRELIISVRQETIKEVGKWLRSRSLEFIRDEETQATFAKGKLPR